MNIYQSIKGLITPARVTKAASTLGEKEENVSKAISSILPSMLGALYTKGATNDIKDAIQLAGKNNLIKDLDRIFEGSGLIDGINPGERAENAFIGSRNEAFPRSIANHSGIKRESADRLSNWVSATVAAWFGNETVHNKQSLSSLLNQLGTEKAVFSKDIPDGVACELNLLVPGACHREEDKKRSMGWVWWIVIILIVAILAFLLFRSCGDRKERTANRTETVVTATDTRTANNNNNTTKIEMKEITLPDGTKLNVRRDGCEDRMISFLNSNEYKNANASQLRNKWFHFDRIDFEFDSATDLTAGSRAHLENIAKILKAYPNAKVRIGGFADQKGTEAVNKEISKERAEYVKSFFAKNGIATGRVSTEGFGDEFAKVPESATDDQRAIDRHIALRFDK